MIFLLLPISNRVTNFQVFLSPPGKIPYIVSRIDKKSENINLKIGEKTMKLKVLKPVGKTIHVSKVHEGDLFMKKDNPEKGLLLRCIDGIIICVNDYKFSTIEFTKPSSNNFNVVLLSPGTTFILEE